MPYRQARKEGLHFIIQGLELWKGVHPTAEDMENNLSLQINASIIVIVSSNNMEIVQ